MKGKPEYKTRRFKREINWPLHLRTNCSGEHTLELVVTEVCRNVLVQSFQTGRYKGMKQTLKCKNANNTISCIVLLCDRREPRQIIIRIWLAAPGGTPGNS